MKKVLFLGVTFALLATLAGFAFQDKPEDIPAGVDPHLWVSVSKNLGIVLEEPKGFSPDITSVRGTLMIRLGRSWRPLYLIPQFRLEPAQQ